MFLRVFPSKESDSSLTRGQTASKKTALTNTSALSARPKTPKCLPGTELRKGPGETWQTTFRPTYDIKNLAQNRLPFSRDTLPVQPTDKEILTYQYTALYSRELKV